jgi:hypothetical protein
MSANTFVTYETRHCPSIPALQALKSLSMCIGSDNKSRRALFVLQDYFEKNPELAENGQMTYFPVYNGKGNYSTASTAQLLAIMASTCGDHQLATDLFPFGYPEIVMDTNLVDGKHLIFTLDKTSGRPTYIIRFIEAGQHIQKRLYRYVYILME